MAEAVPGDARRSCPSSSSPTAPASAPRRWATRCSSSSRTPCSSAPCSRSSPRSRRRDGWSQLLDEAMDGPVTPLVFTTAADDTVRHELAKTAGAGHRLLRHPHEPGRGDPRPYADCTRRPGCTASATSAGYNSRMAAIEFTIEHDDGQSVRGLEKADVILIAPSRCGKTPTSMYLALQHGLFVANYPLVDEDLESSDLPGILRPYPDRCVGLTTTVERLSRVRNERRPGSRYASADQCRWELRRAEAIYDAHRIPVIDSSSRSVEEMATLIVQTRTKNRKGTNNERQRAVVLRPRHGRPRAGRRQERLARRDGLEPGRPRGPGARRLRHDRGRLPPLHRRHRAGRADQRSPRRARHRRRTPAGRGRQGDPGRRGRAAVPRGPRDRHPRGLRPAGRGVRRGAVVRGPVVGDGRGPAGRVVRRPAGDLPQRPRHRRHPGSRSGRSSPRSTTTGRSPTGCTTASSTTTSRCRPGCSGWSAPTSARPA